MRCGEVQVFSTDKEMQQCLGQVNARTVTFMSCCAQTGPYVLTSEVSGTGYQAIEMP